MSSSAPGNTTSRAEVATIDARGIVVVRHRERLFLSYEEFPWFQHQPESKVRNVQELAPEHLYWPDMDVDLSIESIRHPERFPLKSRS